MRFVDFLKITVLLSAGAATLLAAVTVIGIARDSYTGLIVFSAAWWLAAVERVARAAEAAGFKTHWGRKVLEIRPPVRIDKGAGIVGLLHETELAAAVYVGDDVTDLDAFRGLRELREQGTLGYALRVGVRSDETPSELEEEADAMVEGTDGVRDLLQALLD